MSKVTFSELAAKAKAHKMTPEEIREQRINMILGLSSDSSKITYDSVRRYVNESYGKGD